MSRHSIKRMNEIDQRHNRIVRIYKSMKQEHVSTKEYVKLAAITILTWTFIVLMTIAWA